MSTVKRVKGDYSLLVSDGTHALNIVSGDYKIETPGVTPDAPITNNVVITTHTVKVNGNLDVMGDVTYINVSELNVNDPFIVLNTSNTSTYAANAGILTHISAADFAGVRYNTTKEVWEASNNTDASGEVGNWDRIVTENTMPGVTGNDTEILFNQQGEFGASSNLTFDYSKSNLTIAGNTLITGISTVGLAQVLLNTSNNEPTNISNSAVIYHSTQGSGGTGIFVKTDTTSDELVSRSKAIVFGIIF